MLLIGRDLSDQCHPYTGIVTIVFYSTEWLTDLVDKSMTLVRYSCANVKQI
jgi:hypothetical protein